MVECLAWLGVIVIVDFELFVDVLCFVVIDVNDLLLLLWVLVDDSLAEACSIDFVEWVVFKNDVGV